MCMPGNTGAMLSADISLCMNAIAVICVDGANAGAEPPVN